MEKEKDEKFSSPAFSLETDAFCCRSSIFATRADKVILVKCVNHKVGGGIIRKCGRCLSKVFQFSLKPHNCELKRALKRDQVPLVLHVLASVKRKKKH